MSRSAWLAVLVLAFGAIFNGRGLDRLSWWVDEGWTAIVASSDSPAQMLDLVERDVHPPLYFMVLFGWEKAVGDSVFALRFLTLLTLMLGAALTYRAGRALVDAPTGLLAALLLVLHDLVQVLAQEARQYTLAYTLAALVLWCYWRLVQHPTARRWVAFVLAGIALLYTHYWGGWILLALGLHGLVWGGSAARRGVIGAGLAMGAALAPWLPTIQRQIAAVPDGLGHVLPNTTDGFQVLAFQLIGVPELFWGVLIAAGLVVLWQTRGAAVAALLGLATVGVVAASIALNAVYATLWYRSLMVILPLLMILMAAALRFFRPPERRVVLAFVVVQSLAVTSAGPPPRMAWDEIAPYVAARTAPTDVILVDAWFEAYSFNYYTRQQSVPVTRFDAELYRRDHHQADYQQALMRVLSGKGGAWVVRDSADGDLLAWMAQQGYIQTYQWRADTASGLPDLIRFDRLPTTPPLATYAELGLVRADLVRQPDGVMVNLLWQVTAIPTEDYTVSVFLLDSGGHLVAQNDSYPQEGRERTSTWNSYRLVFDPHPLDLRGLPAGTYTIGVKVYYFTDGAAQGYLDVPCDGDAACAYRVVGTLAVGR